MPNATYICQNCERQGAPEHFKPARDVLQRHEPGDTYSDLECPECGALALPLPAEPRRERLLALYQQR